MAKISVIIPCYNQGQYLPETLQSVLNQTHPDWECIIINDGSQDKTEEIALLWTQKDARIKYSKQENGGASRAKNAGLALAEGDFVQFLDADDLIEPEKFRVQSEILLQNNSFDLVYSPVRYFPENDPTAHYLHFSLSNESWQPEISGSGRVVYEELIQQNIFAIHCPLIRKKAIDKTGGFDETLKTHEDYDFWIRMAINTNFFHFDSTPGTFALVRTHPASVSNNRERMNIDYYLVKSKLANFLVDNNIHVFFDAWFEMRFIKKQVTCFYLDKKINLDTYSTVLSSLERKKLHFLSLVPPRLRFHFMMMDRYELSRIFKRVSTRKRKDVEESLKQKS